MRQKTGFTLIELVLVLDQFEEVLTISNTDRDVKLAFFEQLGEALRVKNRWALISMREDYLGSLAPYVRPIPDRLVTRFRLDLLGVDAAIQIRPTGMSQQFERPEEAPRPGAAFVVIGDDVCIGTDAQCTHDRDELFPWRRQAGRGQLIADQRAAIAGNGTGHMGLEIDRFLAEVDDQQAGSAQSGVQRRGFQQQGQRHGGVR